MRVFLTVENEGSDSELEQFVVNLVNADSFDHRNLKKLSSKGPLYEQQTQNPRRSAALC